MPNKHDSWDSSHMTQYNAGNYHSQISTAIPPSHSVDSHATHPLSDDHTEEHLTGSSGAAGGGGARRRNNLTGMLSSMNNRLSRSGDQGGLLQDQSQQHPQQGYYNQPAEATFYDSTDALPPPNLPFAPSASNHQDGGGSDKPFGRRDSSRSLAGSFASDDKRSVGALSVHYLPTKMSSLHVPGSRIHRRPAKRGGGTSAWNVEGHDRMGGEDDDGDRGARATGAMQSSSGKTKKLKWNRFKWILVFANTVLFAYTVAAFTVCLLVWFQIFEKADVIRVGNRTELILSTVAASLMVFVSLLGYAGIVLNNRMFLAWYTFLLWICFAFIVAPGYITYKKKTFNLEGKINYQWSRDLGYDGRLRIQNALHCCGYFSPFVENVVSNTCYPRSILPGCKSRYLKFERYAMQSWYTACFCVVPAHLLIILAALLCSNHVTYRIGKGIMPKQYRLDETSTAHLLNQYAADIAAQYPGLAQEALHRSGSSTLLTEKANPQARMSRASSFSSLRQ